ncbi:MAG: LysM peptidoglycan-binding domain-containing protein [Nitrospinota bacterium]|nr:LysM peptidoglycan-binding domain-containing protein [Nitrospinota bacterium]
MESRVNFWKKVYTQYSTHHAIIHDEDNLDIIYDVVYLGEKSLSSRARHRKLKPHIRKFQKTLRKLARIKNRVNLTPEEERILNLVKKNFIKASRNIRSQLGQSDRFEEGLRKSGLYMKEIKRIFKEVGVPEELAALPHVESSFQLGAYSSAGAAGVWQFTRSTGRRYMKVGYEVDERRDPIVSAYAAAKLLKFNYEQLGSWPLAITAYNHGANGMKRAKRRHGDDIVKVIDNYRSRTFGFASKNFFSEFMAALEVSQHPQQYFPGLVMNEPFKFSEIPIEDYVHISTLEKHFEMSREEIAEYNPSLRRPVISGKKRIPKNYLFKIPIDREFNPDELYASIPEELKFDKQVRVRWYTVQRGDTLSSIARSMRTSVWKLKEMNMIRGHRIYKGQVLEIPGKAYKGGTTRVVSVEEPKPDWGKVVIPPDLETVQYRVRRRDTLTRIARNHGVHVSVLAKLNTMDDPHSLHPGQRIKVPKPGTDFKLLLASAVSQPETPNQLSDVPSDENTVVASVVESLEESPIQARETPVTLDEAQSDGNAIIASITEPSEESLTETPKMEIQMGEVQSGEETVVASASERLEKNSEVEKALSNIVSSFQLNKNRHAFRPVKFVSDNEEDYRMGLIKVDFDETLSHVADWARLSVRELRQLNNLRRRGSRVRVNQSIKVPFRRTTPEEFERKRQEYHKAIQEDFFGNYQVEKVVTRKLKKGETLWEICNDVYSIPFWLLSNYNPDTDINSVSVGASINIPVLTDNPS